MSVGWTDPLLVFAMDHRDSYRRLLGLGDTAADTDVARRLKRLVLDGFVEALDQLTDRTGTALLVDEEYGAALVGAARDAGALVCLPLERSGQTELQWEYGADPAAATTVVEQLRPDLVKVLLRYNPGGDADLNARQSARLAEMSDWCAARSLPLMVEVLIPPTSEQRAATPDPERWDADVRPRLLLETINSLRAAGADPAVWKIEGLDDPDQAAEVVDVARAGGRDDVSCIVLGRGADLERVEAWLRIGATTPGFVGFAVGRSLWNAPALAHARGEIAAAEVARTVAANYLRLCATWQGAVVRSA